jgi:hypothetical protein
MALLRKSIIAQSIIALFLGQMTLSKQGGLEVQAAYSSGMNPGMQMRIE